MTAERDVIQLLARLIQFDTSNWGDGRAHGEFEAAEWIAGLLESVGYDPVILAHPQHRGRANLVVRVPGHDRSLPALLVHGHLDVVPAEAHEWSVDPFSGTVRDGWIIGRGAMDMKDTCASVIASVLAMADQGVRPRRDLVIAFVADEEDMGVYGAQWLVDNHPELFEGCEAAIGEDGAIWTPTRSVEGAPVSLYPIACGERGALHVKLTAHGESGHGSRPTKVDAVHRMIEALHRISHHDWPLMLSDVVRAQIEQTAAAIGMRVDVSDNASVLRLIAELGEAAGALRYTIRATSTPTIVHAGYKSNVVPGVAHAEVDVRCPPGQEDAVEQTLAELIGPGVEWELAHRITGLESRFDNHWFGEMADALRRHDPAAQVVPMCMGGGTDAKAFSELGIQCYGFTPIMVDPLGRGPRAIHGVDERNSVVGLRAGQRVMQDFLTRV